MVTNRIFPCCQTLLVLAVILAYVAADCNVLNSSKPFQLDEDEPVGHVVANFSANSLSILKTNLANNEEMDLLNATASGGQGVIMVQKELDAETMKDVEFTYLCSDSSGTNQQKAVYLIIKGVNEYAPQFSKPDHSINVNEDLPVATSIFKTEAVDPDKTSSTTTFIYKIVDGSRGYFNITLNDGNVFIMKQLDFEKDHAPYVLNISATESLSDGKTNYTTLTVNVIDVDDLMPRFTGSDYIVSIPEGDYDGSKWFSTQPRLAAEDGDHHLNKSIDLEIDNSTNQLYRNLFSVAQNGLISVYGKVEVGEYTVVIRASQTNNHEMRYAITTLTVMVTDINDHAPSMDQPYYSANVSEAASPGTVVLIVTAHDDDWDNNSAIEFHLGQSVNGTFRVVTEQNRGIIELTDYLDRETTSTYNFTVWAKETNTFDKMESNRSTVKITVVDENDNSPIFSESDYTFYLNRTGKKGDLVGQVHATDDDSGLNGKIIYSIKASKFLEIDSTGNLTLKNDLSYSDIGTYSSIVIASDNAAVNPRTSYAAVTVNILPINDSPPTFVNAPYIFQIPETTLKGSVIGQVSATDVDDDSLTFTLSGPNANYLNLDSSNGSITIATSVDLDSKSSTIPQNFTVKATVNDGRHQTDTNVEVSILYVNEFLPKFEPQGPVSVNENAASATSIVQVTAIDGDQGQGGHVTYSLIQTATSSFFKIDPNSGIIILNCSKCLDYKQERTFDIVIQATDDGVPPKLSITSVLVYVNETVLESPKFYEDIYHVNLLENSTAPVFLQVLASDPDTDQSQLKYSYTVPSNLGSPFPITTFENGTVIFNGPFDAELVDHFVIDVTVTDGHSSNTAEIDVTVTDMNEYAPVLNITSSDRILLPENSQDGEFVMAVGAEDADKTSSGFYYFLTSGTGGKFNIDISTGVITVAGPLDRRQKPVYNITVTVLDSGVPPKLTSGNIIIVVADSNIAPQFVDEDNNFVQSYNFSIPEDLTAGHLVGSVYAIDPDAGSSGDLSFKILSGNSNGIFTLDKKSGNLTLAQSVDYEDDPEYTLSVVVSDNSYDPKSATAVVTVTVENVIEAPQWPLPLPTVYITQSSTICKNQQLQLQAFSKEVTSLSTVGETSVDYTLLNTTNEFSINRTTGLLTITKQLSVGVYSVCLKACNAGQYSECSEAVLTVKVKNNNNILAFCPTFYNVEVNESAAVNSSILMLNTTNSGSTVLYNISKGNDERTFSVGEDNGVLYIAQKLDREKTPSYVLFITAKDTSSQQEAEAQVIIRILDAEDESPSFSAITYQGEILESQPAGTAVFIPSTKKQLVVSATDKDEHSKLTYSIDPVSDKSNGSFTIDANAAISLVKEIDYEQIPANLNKMYTFEVLVTDGMHSSTATVTVHVLDDNDNVPVFDDKNDITLNITEGQQSVKFSASIKANDPDVNTRLQYSLDVIKPAGSTQRFSIDELSGQLRVIQELDRELVDEYILNVTVTDGKYSAWKSVTVLVLDVNDNSPQFNITVYNMTVTEGKNGVGTNITILAHDNDIGPNAVLFYSISSGNVNGSFDVDEKGLFKTVGPLDREAAVLYYGTSILQLVVEAQDTGDSTKTATAVVLVTIQDINDNPPKFSQSKYYATVSENATNSSISVNPPISVTDIDTDSCNGITFDLLNPSTPFEVDKNSGNLFLIGELDRETVDQYTLLITATDDCGHGLSSSAEIVVTVTDVNDEAPYFLSDSYSFNILENSTQFQTVGTVKAYDNDTTGGFIVYSFVTVSKMFYIDDVKGEIKVLGDLNEPDYTLNVSACDENYQCSYVKVIINVADTNNICPVWNTTSLNFYVKEGWGPGKIGHISVNNGDPATVQYFLNNTASQNVIDVSSSGEVKLLTQLKTSTSDQYVLNFTVYAQHIGQISCISPGTLKIIVIEVNNTKPQICYNKQCGIQTIELLVFNGSQAGTFIALIETHDSDIGIYGEVNLKLTSSNTKASDLFRIDVHGIIFLNKDITRSYLKAQQLININDTLELSLLAIDGGNETESAKVMVKIIDLIPDVPTFSNQSYIMFVRENEKNGTYVGTVNAMSKSGLMYSIFMVDKAEPFAIEQHSGSITTTMELDREAVGSYVFIVQATDSQKLSSSAVVVVNVEDVNEPPKFDDKDITLTAEEEKLADLAKLLANDPDEGVNGTVKYSIVNASLYPDFMINSSSGVLSVIHTLDREKKSNYKFIVQAVDSGKSPLTASLNVHIIVSDINDNAPHFIQPDYQSNISKSAPPIKVIKVTANDPDYGPNGRIIYFLQSNFHTFSIDPLSGEIHTFAIPSEETYELVVVATDQGNSPLSATVNVTVKVMENRTETEASLILSTQYVQLFVGMISGTELDVKITTADLDSLQISGGNGTNIFRIQKGKIILGQDLIRTSTYLLNISATSSTLHTVARELIVDVDTVKFKQPNYVAVVPENRKGREVIADIDSDAEQLGMPVIYSLANYSSIFSINKTTGVVWILQELDREILPVYVLVVSLHLDPAAQPIHYRHRRAVSTTIGEEFVDLIVRVEDVNDNVPTFGNLGPELHLSVSENVNASYLIITLKAFDSDEGYNGQILYSMTNKENVFQLDPVSGELRIASPEKLKDQISFTLTIQATDRNGTGSSTSLIVKISVVQNGNQFQLPTPVSLFILQKNWPTILAQLGEILGFNLTTTELILHKDSNGVAQDSSDILFEATKGEGNMTTHLSASQIGDKVLEKQAEIEALFKSYLTQPKQEDKKSMNAESIALIALACAMFVVSLVAIFVAYRMWRKQKKYAEKEEKATKARQHIEEHSNVGNVKETSLASGPDEHLEMTIISEVLSTSVSGNVQEQTRTIYFDTDLTPADTSGLQNLQEFLQPLASESKDSGIASPHNSDSETSGQESPSNSQKGEVQEPSLSEQITARQINDQDVAGIDDSPNKDNSYSSETNDSKENNNAEQTETEAASSCTQGDKNTPHSGINNTQPASVVVPQNSNHNLPSDQQELPVNSEVNDSKKSALVMMNEAFQTINEDDLSEIEAITHF